MATFRRDRDEDESERLSAGDAQAAPLTGQGSFSAGAPAGGGAKDFTKSNFVSGKRILEKNRNVAQPDLTEGFRQDAAGQRKAMETGFQGFQKDLTARDRAYDLDARDFERGLAGDERSFQRIQNLLAGPQGAAKTFNGQSNLNIQDVNALRTGAGVQSALQDKMQRSGNYGYTQGQSALDSLLFGRSQSGRDQVLSAANEKGAIDNEFAKKREDSAKAAKAVDQKIAERQKNTRGSLLENQAALSKAAQEKADFQKLVLENNGWERGIEARRFIPEASRIGDEIAASITDPALREEFLKKFNADGGGYVDFVKMGDVSGPMYSADEAARFNRIMGLLGQGGQRAQEGRVSDPTFDRNAYMNHVRQNVLAPLEQISARNAANSAEEQRRAVARQMGSSPEQRNGSNEIWGVPTPFDTPMPGDAKVGGTLGKTTEGVKKKLFCFAKGTPVLMADGSHRAVEDLSLGDLTAYGGAVTYRSEFDAEDMWDYHGTVLTGSHAVFENGQWVRVEDAEESEVMEDGVPTKVYPISTEYHFLVSDNQILFRDYEELDASLDMSDEEIIEILNTSYHVRVAEDILKDLSAGGN